MFSKMKDRITQFIKRYLLAPLLPSPIKKKRDCVFKIVFLCFGALCFIGGVTMGIFVGSTSGFVGGEAVIFILFFLGLCCSLPFVPKIFVTTFRAGKTAYAVGKASTMTENVEVQQVSSTQYRVHSYKTHQGGEFAIGIGVVTFFLTWFFYWLLGPFMLGYKMYKNAQLVYLYKREWDQAKAKARVTEEEIPAQQEECKEVK